MSQPAHELFCFAHLTDVRSLVPPRYCYSFTGQGLMAGDGCEQHWQSKGSSRGAHCVWDASVEGGGRCLIAGWLSRVSLSVGCRESVACVQLTKKELQISIILYL